MSAPEAVVSGQHKLLPAMWADRVVAGNRQLQGLALMQVAVQPAVVIPHAWQCTRSHPDEKTHITDPAIRPVCTYDVLVAIGEPRLCVALGTIVRRVLVPVEVGLPRNPVAYDLVALYHEGVVEHARRLHATWDYVLPVPVYPCRVQADLLADAIIHVLPSQFPAHLRLEVVVVILIEGSDIIIKQNGSRHILLYRDVNRAIERLVWSRASGLS
mmetsp:Transcript_21484/g.62196  ORF Transcript_21484/g.62196 Transcript_21484/m.62196 type:complete len:214 (+) Transcript_21484:135-776(+)